MTRKTQLFSTVGALIAAGSLAGCNKAGPATATALNVTQPVCVGKVRDLGGGQLDDWGSSQGEIDVDVKNVEQPTGGGGYRTLKEGSEKVGTEMLKQAGMCPLCPIQLDGIEVISRAGAAGVSRVILEGEVRPAAKKEGGE